MKIKTYQTKFKEVPLTLKSLDESFMDMTNDKVDIPDFTDEETLEDYLDACDIEFSKEEIKQLPKLYKDWLKENPDVVESIQIRNKLFKAINPLVEKYGEYAVWNEIDVLKSY